MTQGRYEVVIRPQNGYSKGLAEVVRKELLRSPEWTDKDVTVRPIQENDH